MLPITYNPRYLFVHFDWKSFGKWFSLRNCGALSHDHQGLPTGGQHMPYLLFLYFFLYFSFTLLPHMPFLLFLRIARPHHISFICNSLPTLCSYISFNVCSPVDSSWVWKEIWFIIIVGCLFAQWANGQMGKWASHKKGILELIFAKPASLAFFSAPTSG